MKANTRIASSALSKAASPSRSNKTSPGASTARPVKGAPWLRTRQRPLVTSPHSAIISSSASAPIVEQVLAENDRAKWPLIILHFDFKSLDPKLLRAVWDLLGEYQSWITTAPQTADPHELAPVEPKPLLVLTEDADAQERVFFREIPADARLRVFGSAHTAPIRAK